VPEEPSPGSQGIRRDPAASSRTSAGVTLGVLALLSIALRFPYFFPAVINWDESTFILIGQSLLDGALPYTNLWDVKPPLLFGFFALVIGGFGHDIVGVRLAGALCVTIAAFLVHRIARRWWGPKEAAFAAGLTVFMLSARRLSGVATMSELVVLPALLGAVYCWLDDPPKRRYLLMGALLAAATLIRTNAAIAVLAAGLLIALEARHRNSFRPVVAFVAGGMLVVLLTCLPFLLAGDLDAMWNATVVAGFARTGAELPVWQNVLRLGGGALGLSSELSGWLEPFFWGAALVGLVLVFRKPRQDRPAGFPAGAVLALATALSIAISGGDHAHYLLQLVPFAALFAAGLLASLATTGRRVLWATASLAAVSALPPVVGMYDQVRSLAASGQALRHGPAYEIAAFLERENPERRPVFLLTDHIAYWLLRTAPPTPFVTHPSTLAKPAVLTALGTTAPLELKRVFDHQPELVVLQPNDWFLTDELGLAIQAELARNYSPVLDIQGRRIYRRTPPVSRPPAPAAEPGSTRR
jgi:hypothetical protein